MPSLVEILQAIATLLACGLIPFAMTGYPCCCAPDIDCPADDPTFQCTTGEQCDGDVRSRYMAVTFSDVADDNCTGSGTFNATYVLECTSLCEWGGGYDGTAIKNFSHTFETCVTSSRLAGGNGMDIVMRIAGTASTNILSWRVQATTRASLSIENYAFNYNQATVAYCTAESTPYDCMAFSEVSSCTSRARFGGTETRFAYSVASASCSVVSQ